MAAERNLPADQRRVLRHMTVAPLMVERTHPCRRRARFAGDGPRVSVKVADALIAAGLIEPDPTRAQPDWCTYYRLRAKPD